MVFGPHAQFKNNNNNNKSSKGHEGLKVI